jgi:membrane protein implicated in regulation of membrane protease activity
MTRNRILILMALVLAPFVFLVGVGTYHLWITGWTLIVWWPMAACLTAAYGLSWYWTRKKLTEAHRQWSRPS